MDFRKSSFPMGIILLFAINMVTVEKFETLFIMAAKLYGMKRALNRRKVKERFDRIASLYDRVFSFPIASSIERREIKAVSGLLDVEGKSVLDVGCGYGKFSREWEEKNARLIVGLDFSKNMLKRAKNRNRNSHFVLGDAFNTPFKDKCFDVSTCIGLPLYYENIDGLFEEMARLTRKACVVSFPPRCFLGIAHSAMSKLRIPINRVERVKELCSRVFSRYTMHCTSYGALICKGKLH
jgi:ubiquinone/menaquinone biosynthesis C-methylase UbiE